MFRRLTVSGTAAIAAASALLATSGPVSAAAPWECGSSWGCVYEHAGGEGERYALLYNNCANTYLPPAWLDRVSSIRTYSRGVWLDNGKGQFKWYEPYSKSNISWDYNDRATNYRVDC
ncbi:hypothetical protein GCM10010485_60220 [Streptosporangium carneum]